MRGDSKLENLFRQNGSYYRKSDGKAVTWDEQDADRVCGMADFWVAFSNGTESEYQFKMEVRARGLMAAARLLDPNVAPLPAVETVYSCGCVGDRQFQRIHNSSPNCGKA